MSKKKKKTLEEIRAKFDLEEKRSDVDFDDFVRRKNIRLQGELAKLEAANLKLEHKLQQQRIAEVQALLKKKKDDKDDQ